MLKLQLAGTQLNVPLETIMTKDSDQTISEILDPDKTPEQQAIAILGRKIIKLAERIDKLEETSANHEERIESNEDTLAPARKLRTIVLAGIAGALTLSVTEYFTGFFSSIIESFTP